MGGGNAERNKKLTNFEFLRNIKPGDKCLYLLRPARILEVGDSNSWNNEKTEVKLIYLDGECETTTTGVQNSRVA